MKKLVGYIISVVGILVMVVSFGGINLGLDFLNNLDKKYIMIAGIILIILGVVFSLTDKSSSKKKKIEHASEEVPIYSGEGKGRKIVAYRKD